MSVRASQRRRPQPAYVLQTLWRPGERTAAWEQLWRKLLAQTARERDGTTEPASAKPAVLR